MARVCNARKENYKMISGSFYIPKDNPSKPYGEDAHFICAEEQTIGVADGVGGWAKRGIDAGEYARQLMKNSAIAVIFNEPTGDVDPKRVLNQAYASTKAEGSSTGCIIALKGKCIHAANVGDSGFMVFRKGEMIFKSRAMQRGFNRPYQLGNGKGCDRPSDAEELVVAVEPGDVIVTATDGLLDNMLQTEMEYIIKHSGEKEGPQQLAWTLVAVAFYNSTDKNADTPFARASKHAGHNHKGGKIDDITAVVSYVFSELD
ncbi:probable protein phosphatase 2C 55 [Malania oleifera]|uniref:probable protein phosphatase 2C 55 n=1 Tax=Malania oleifera TaxID=397392 RepID=UPI0025AE1551|nr:probable protein phosphatase 2C 55 [Malania oleifera]